MKSKHFEFGNLIRLVFIAVLFGVVFSAGSGLVMAQKPPILKRYTDDKQLCGSSGNLINTEYCDKWTIYKDTTKSANERKIARDAMIELLRGQIDEYYKSHKDGRRVKVQWLQMIFDILEIGASMTIDFINGERSKSVIAAVLSGFKGGRSAFNKNFEILQMQVLINKMNADRDRRLTQIIQNMNKNIDDYSWLKAKNELRDYFFAGTFGNAMDSLVEKTGDDAVTAAADLASAKRNAGIVLAPTAAQYKASMDTAAVIDAIADDWVAEDEKRVEAEEQIEAADAKIETAERANPVDTAKKQEGVAEKAAAEQAKQAAQDNQSKAFDRVKAIYDLIEADAELAPLLDRINAKYPLIKTTTDATRQRIDNDNGSFEDYVYMIQKLTRVAVDEMSSKPTLIEKIKNILDATK